MISHNAFSIRLIPAWGWNLLALLFAAFALVVAVWSTNGIAAVPVLRLSVAVLGCAAIAAGSRGHFVAVALNIGKRIQKNRIRFRPWLIFVLLLGWGVVYVLTSIGRQLHEYTQVSVVHTQLRRIGGVLFQYVREHDQKLPPDITAQTIGAYLAPYRPEVSLIDPSSNKPFIWRHSLSGININKIKHPEKVIVAYSLPQYDSKYRAVLFLDGNSFQRSEEHFWELMHEQRKLLHEK